MVQRLKEQFEYTASIWPHLVYPDKAEFSMLPPSLYDHPVIEHHSSGTLQPGDKRNCRTEPQILTIKRGCCRKRISDTCDHDNPMVWEVRKECRRFLYAG